MSKQYRWNRATCQLKCIEQPSTLQQADAHWQTVTVTCLKCSLECPETIAAEMGVLGPY